MKRIFLLFALFPILAIGQKTTNLNKTYPDSTWSKITLGQIDADNTASTADADGKHYYDFTVTGTYDPASLAEVNSGYFAYNKTAGSNGTYVINALEGVARSSYADEAGTFRGVYGRIYINAGTTATMRTGVGGEFSARAGYLGGTECVAEGGTAFVGARIWMAPYFTAGSLSNITNFHGLWLHNESPSRAVNNAIYVNDVSGGTAGWNYGLNLNDAIINTSDIILSEGATLNNIRAGNLTVTEDTVEVVGVLKATSILGVVSDSTFVTVTGDTVKVDTILLPDASQGADIGNSSTPFNKIYGDSIIANTLVISDSVALETIVSLQSDTMPQFTFNVGYGFDTDSTLFSTSGIYFSDNSFTKGSDSTIITELRAVMIAGNTPSGTDTLAIQVYWNDTINVTGAGAIKLNTSDLGINSITTGTIDASFNNNTIPPNVWVFLKIPGVVTGRKPEGLTVVLSGYKQNRSY